MDYISKGNLYIDGKKIKNLPYMVGFSGSIPIVIGLDINGYAWFIEIRLDTVFSKKFSHGISQVYIHSYKYISLINKNGMISNFELENTSGTLHVQDIPHTFEVNDPPKFVKTCREFVLDEHGFVYILQDGCYAKINDFSNIKDIVLFDISHLVVLNVHGEAWDYKNGKLYPWTGSPFSHIGARVAIDKNKILCVYGSWATKEYHFPWVDKIKFIGICYPSHIILTNEEQLYTTGDKPNNLVLIANNVDTIADHM